MSRIFDLEMDLRNEARVLGMVEADLAQEYIRLVAAGTPTWLAQKQAELELGTSVHVQRAEYEIALARLKSGSTAP